VRKCWSSSESFNSKIESEGGIISWGIAEARGLGVFDLIRSCSDELRYWDTYTGERVERRDLVATTVQHEPSLGFYHPALQEILLRSAEESGAEICRGASVQKVALGIPTEVLFDRNGTPHRIAARLVVGADGRTSAMRRYFADSVRRDPPRRLMAGVLLENVSALPTDAVRFQPNPELSFASLLLPRGGTHTRAYLVYPHDSGYRLQGGAGLPRFVGESVRAGLPPSMLERSKIIGPLASFEGADTWVEHPYQQGLVLIGDAAASSDPSFGQGLSLTLRDVRVLRDSLLSSADWDKAGHVYADQHDHYYELSGKRPNYLPPCFTTAAPRQRHGGQRPCRESRRIRAVCRIICSADRTCL